MKKIIFLALIGSLFLTNCTKTDTVNPAEIEVNEAVKSSLRVAFPNATNISFSEVSPNEVVADFTEKRSEYIAGITKAGKVLFTAEKITEATLPAIVLDYLTANYPGYILKRAGEKKDKAGVTLGYSVDITQNEKNYHLHFDATGKFVSSIERTGKHNGKGVKVAQADLPIAIKTYIADKYPNYTFTDAISFSVDNTVKGYGVRIVTAEKAEVGLIFDGAGTFLRSREGDLGHHSGKGPGHGKDGKGGGKGKDGRTVVKIEKTTLPADVLNYIDTKYAGYVLKYAESYSLNGVIEKYEVEFTLSGKVYEVYFDAKGKFLIEKIKN
jgi:hypothetical protein